MSSRENGFMRWADARRPGNDDDSPGDAAPISITEPPADDREAVQEPPGQECAGTT
jgi:hypothetical protein